jgi:alpha-amylase/alpha-mannosidase (GH57 family)
MHQPVYCEPNSDRLVLPWVRLHALKDYLDMPLQAASHEQVKVTFNLVPSLLDQLDLYLNGGTDRHLELSRLPADQISDTVRLEILESFFAVYATNMIRPYSRFWELYKKVQNNSGRKDLLPALCTSAEIRDIQVWSNLVWVDPTFRREEPIASLFERQRNFTEEDKHSLLDWQHNLIGRIVRTYQDLLNQGKIDISFTPYYHPILPLLCDTDSAREALPGVRLPRKRFQHPEDAEYQIARAADKYREIFGREMKGMWPSEGSVSEESLRLIREQGIEWVATDQDVLYQSLSKSQLPLADYSRHEMFEYNGGLKMFFRDHDLSDRIGFVYSGWEAERAVDDFIQRIKEIREESLDDLDQTIVPVILDGENAWEYFPEDGTLFLERFYKKLGEDPEIELVTFSEAAGQMPSRELPSVFAGSWINHNFQIWIGHNEDNAAWDLLTMTREALFLFEKDNPDFDQAKLRAAWEQVYIAEGSDWCWWYGDDHRGHHNAQFDKIYRSHLIAVYEHLGLDVPMDLLKPIHTGVEISYTVPPEDMLTATIDGRLSHFYEWTGAGYFDCLKAGGAMHRVDRQISGIHFAYDH